MVRLLDAHRVGLRNAQPGPAGGRDGVLEWDGGVAVTTLESSQAIYFRFGPTTPKPIRGYFGRSYRSTQTGGKSQLLEPAALNIFGY
jgi:hypothetical protein